MEIQCRGSGLFFRLPLRKKKPNFAKKVITDADNRLVLGRFEAGDEIGACEPDPIVIDWKRFSRTKERGLFLSRLNLSLFLDIEFSLLARVQQQNIRPDFLELRFSTAKDDVVFAAGSIEFPRSFE
jgi:hypothetical protein